MNLFNLGLRNFLGILLPGALLVLALLACVALLLPDARPMVAATLTDKTALAAAAIFLVSYIAGSVIRLYAADNVDRISAKLVRLDSDPFKGQPGSVEDKLAGLLASVTNPDLDCKPSNDVIGWAWKYDKFPYPVWECIKIRLYHPPEMAKFFLSYRGFLGTGDRRGKEFFNYCKAVIFHAHEGRPHALAGEIQAAEGVVRFFAGTFWASFLAASILAGTTIRLALDKNAPKGAAPATATAALLLAFTALAIVGWGRFRRMRLKEVDTVFDAFYLIHRHDQDCAQCSPAKPQVSRLFVQRRELVEEAFKAGLSLKTLVSLMKTRSTSGAALASLYFAGTDHDHPYCLDTDRVAIGLAVLPEDRVKCGTPKRHPHQHETVIVVDGTIYLDMMNDGGWLRTALSVGEVKVIPPGVYHRIVSGNEKDAAFFFIKTNPAKEPRSEPYDGGADKIVLIQKATADAQSGFYPESNTERV